MGAGRLTLCVLLAALIIRAISVLEGIALVADPEFQIIQAAYPFISRKLLTDQSPRLKAALHYMASLSVPFSLQGLRMQAASCSQSCASAAFRCALVLL